MTEHHRAYAEKVYDALNRRDIDTFIESVADDVEFRSLIAEADTETFRGREGIRSWWEQVVEALGGLDFEIQGFEEHGDGIVTRTRVRGSVGATGIEQTMWQGAVVRDGVAVWWQTFRREDEAWAAVRERQGR
jgi:ketosteroid isomerase-like protein